MKKIWKARCFLDVPGGLAVMLGRLITPYELLDFLKQIERFGHHEIARALSGQRS